MHIIEAVTHEHFESANSICQECEPLVTRCIVVGDLYWSPATYNFVLK